MKKVVFILKGDPFSWKSHEALRVGMAVGINAEVHFVFLKDGVYTISRWSPDSLGIVGFERLLENIDYVNVRLYAEDLSLEERGLKKEDLRKEVHVISMEEIKELIASSEAVFVW